MTKLHVESDAVAALDDKRRWKFGTPLLEKSCSIAFSPKSPSKSRMMSMKWTDADLLIDDDRLLKLQKLHAFSVCHCLVERAVSFSFMN